MASEKGSPVCGARTPWQMPAYRGVFGFRLSFADDLAAGGSVTLAGLLHAGADELFEMLLCGHC
jgi:hypothetical protein